MYVGYTCKSAVTQVHGCKCSHLQTQLHYVNLQWLHVYDFIIHIGRTILSKRLLSEASYCCYFHAWILSFYYGKWRSSSNRVHTCPRLNGKSEVFHTCMHYFGGICSVQHANLANLQIGQPICKLRCTVCQLPRNLYNYIICKLCQQISFHSKKAFNVGRQQSKILTIVISVNIFHGKLLPVMIISCHSLCGISSFNTRYLSRNH